MINELSERTSERIICHIIIWGSKNYITRWLESLMTYRFYVLNFVI